MISFIPFQKCSLNRRVRRTDISASHVIIIMADDTKPNLRDISKDYFTQLRTVDT